MKKLIKIQGIPSFGAEWYLLIARKLKDLYDVVAEEVTTRISQGKILDIGTGPGYLLVEIAKRTPSLEIIGIDLSPAMVKIANRNVKDMGFSERVKFQTGSAASLPFDDGYFDFVISTASFHQWLKPIECLKEIYRVLKESGEAWIYDINREITKEVRTEVRRKYGWFLSSFFLYVVRPHSVRCKEVEEILSSPEIGFSKKSIENKGVMLKIKLCK